MAFMSHAGNTRLERMTSASMKKSSEELNKEFEMLDKEKIKYERKHSREVENMKRLQKSLQCSTGHFQPEVPKIVIDDSFVRKRKQNMYRDPQRSPTPAFSSCGEYDGDLLTELSNDDNFSELPELSSQTKYYLAPPKIQQRHRRTRTYPDKDLWKSRSRNNLSEDNLSSLHLPKRNGSVQNECRDSTHSACPKTGHNLSQEFSAIENEKYRRLSLPALDKITSEFSRENPADQLVGNIDCLSVPRVSSGRRLSLPSEHFRSSAKQSVQNSTNRTLENNLIDKCNHRIAKSYSGFTSLPPAFEKSRQEVIPTVLKPQALPETMQSSKFNNFHKRGRRQSLGCPPIHSSTQSSFDENTTESLEDINKTISVVNLELNIPEVFRINDNFSNGRNSKVLNVKSVPELSNGGGNTALESEYVTVLKKLDQIMASFRGEADGCEDWMKPA